MNIIKRSGEEMEFERGKIAAAIRKANETVEDADKLTEARIERIAQQIEDFARTYDRALSVEEIQDLVETKIQEAGAHAVAKKYIKYRFIQSLKRQHNTTDGEILTLINCTNEEAKQENANKNPTINSVQRDYMAGAVSKDVTKRLLLPEEVVKAHDAGILHFLEIHEIAADAQLRSRESRGHASERHGDQRHDDRPSALFLDGVQHRHADHRAGGVKPVRRAVHLAHAPCAVRAG